MIPRNQIAWSAMNVALAVVTMLAYPDLWPFAMATVFVAGMNAGAVLTLLGLWKPGAPE